MVDTSQGQVFTRKNKIPHVTNLGAGWQDLQKSKEQRAKGQKNKE